LTEDFVLQEGLVNARIDAALGKAARIVGRPQSLYRPTSSTNPTDGTPFTTIYAAFDVHADFKLISTAQQNRSFVTLLADPSLVEKNDCLVGDDLYFVSRVEPLRPSLCVICNYVIDIFSASTATTSAGSNSYGGLAPASSVTIATGWPASMTARTRGEVDVTRLPSDVRAAYYDVLLPEIPGVQLTFGMQIQDASGQLYEIISADLSLFGWKLFAGLVTT
jgi:hypothetical protein